MVATLSHMEDSADKARSRVGAIRSEINDLNCSKRELLSTINLDGASNDLGWHNKSLDKVQKIETKLKSMSHQLREALTHLVQVEKELVDVKLAVEEENEAKFVSICASRTAWGCC